MSSHDIDRGIEAYLKKLIGRKDVEEALQRLDQLTQEECRMAAAEALAITRSIDDKVMTVDDKVKDVGEKVENLDEKMQGVNIKVDAIDDNVQTVDRNVQCVDHKVGSVIQGQLYLHRPHQYQSSTFHSTRCKGDRNKASTSRQSSH